MKINFVFVVEFLSFAFMKFLDCARNRHLKSRGDRAEIGRGFLHFTDAVASHSGLM